MSLGAESEFQAAMQQRLFTESGIRCRPNMGLQYGAFAKPLIFPAWSCSKHATEGRSFIMPDYAATVLFCVRISATLLGAVCLAPPPCSDSTCHCLFSFLLSPSSSLLGSGRGICRAHARLDPSSHSLHYLSVWESCLLGSNPHTPPSPVP